MSHNSLAPQVGDTANLLLKKLVTATGGISGGGGGGDVASVNGQTGVVVLNAADIGAAPEWPAVGTDQTVYVEVWGDDVTGDGTPSNPYATVGKAMSVIVDATTAKRYLIAVGVGTFVEGADLAFKPFVKVQGSGMRITTITVSNSYEFEDTVVASVNYWAVSDLTMDRSGGTQSVFVGGTNSSTGSLLSLNAVRFVASLYFRYLSTFYGNTHLVNCNGTGGTNLQFTKQNVLIQGGDLGEFVEATRSDAAIGADIIAIGARINEARLWSQFDDAPCTFTLVGCVVNAFRTTGSTVTFLYDSASFNVADLTIVAGTPTLTPISLAENEAYTATTPADWAGSPPTTVQEAIDRIAAFNPGA